MALATQCPHCQTTFRVANDQLKLHAGIVRCGSCQQIFNGIEHLVAPGATPATPATPAARTTPAIPEPVAAAAAATTAAVAHTESPAPAEADSLDFDLGIFDDNPLPLAKSPAKPVEEKREPKLEPILEPAPEAAAVSLADEDAELQQRMALLAAAEEDWSVSDEGVVAKTEEPPEDPPLTPDADEFQPALHAGLVSEPSGSSEYALPAAPAADIKHEESEFEPEFEPEFLSEFESVFEEEIGTEAVQDNMQDHAQAVSLAEPEDDPAPDELQTDEGNAEEADAQLLLADTAHAGDEGAAPETLDADAEEALEAASVHPELIDEQVSSLSESEAPAFVLQAERRQARSKAVRITMAVLSVLLFFGLLAQVTYTMRNQLAAWFPQARPALADACKILNCQITLLTQIDAISMESNELQALAPNKNVFSLVLLLRNKGSTTQAWPMLELTLDNDKEQPVLRKVFTPAEYLANKSDLIKGFAGSSEQPVKLYFELETIKAAGYHVWLFYP
ncbi:DUF3426 domain-containing protein [Undibacterium terreum]|uniref:Zinc finger/thioredoxin putative domain-containing protein n=1 Tax=Undibacterium terreum TaxID=1224302 RepID=A0A916UQW4_9BURK|nr:DUF3426 domain-containing protein [Undibacterium terreum]GGC82325.1 hypothetical protein GCM10011396_32060 [Undibacterium terreum]